MEYIVHVHNMREVLVETKNTENIKANKHLYEEKAILF